MLFGAILLVVSMPLVLYVFELNRMIPIPATMKATSEAAASTVRALLQMPGWPDLLANLFLIGVIPALGEELLFRGILQGQLMRRWSPWAAIILSGAVFSFVHFQMEGFFPRWILGVLLGWLFWKTSNFWVPVFVHFLNNGAQVLGAYFVKGTPELVDLEQQVQVPWVLAFASLIGTLSLLWYGGRRLNGLHLGS
jgi:membrane protease YdiL (CAAX protease family)